MSNETWDFIEKTLKVLMEQSDRLEDSTKGLLLAPESPITECFNTIAESLILSLERLAEDKYHAISWFVFECDFGRDAKEAGLKDGETRLIDSFENLRWLFKIF